MKISIITVCYNSAKTVCDTLRSVATQNHSDIEHVVIDGASKDDTLEMVRQHGRHVAKLLSEPDSGIYDAMNKGLRLATGDLVGCLNADDMLAHENVLSRVAETAANGKLVDAVYGDLEYVTPEPPHRVVRRWRSGSFSLSRLRFGWMPPHPAFYVRRSWLEEMGGFDTSLRIAADYDFMVRCLRRPGVRVEYLPEVLVRMRTGGASNRSLKALLRKSKEDLQVIRRNEVGSWFTLICKNARKLPQFLITS